MKKWILCVTTLLYCNMSIAHDMGYKSDAIADGFFLGLGGSYNSINLTQNSWGQGISNVQTSSGTVTNGIAQGTGAPFHDITDTFAPVFQMGLFKHMQNSPNLYGFKFIYQYLNSIATNSNLYIPQLGNSINQTGTISSLNGYVNGDSIQVAANHQLNLLAFVGRSFGNKFIYIGLGPTVFNIQSNNYYSIGYADYEGATLNITGLVSYSTPSLWVWGGALQLGATYFISPTWFIDASYTYARSGNTTVSHEQAFSNSSSLGSLTYSTVGVLFTKDTLSINNQSLMISINKKFDF